MGILFDAAGFFAFQVGFIFLEGWATLLLYRQGGIHRALAKPGNWLSDLGLTFFVTWCGCMSQGAVFAVQGEPRRAARLMLRAASLRGTLLLVLVLLGAPWWVGLVWLVWVEAGVLFLTRKPLLSSGALFLARRSDAPIERALGDAWAETREMVGSYGAVLVLLDLGMALVLSQPLPELSSELWAGVGLVVGWVLPVDLLGLVPAVLVWAAPGALVWPLVIGVEVGSRRSQRVAHGYLKPGRERDWTRWMRVLPLVVAVILAITTSGG